MCALYGTNYTVCLTTGLPYLGRHSRVKTINITPVLLVFQTVDDLRAF
jgi:hypothetical protein